MSKLTIELDDKAAGVVKAAAETAKKPLQEWLRESVCQAASATLKSTNSTAGRISPLHPGAMEAAPDFNAPLEEFAAYS